MDKSLAVGNNVVKNVFLNLDNAVTESGLLKYSGALDLSTIPSDGCSDLDAGYWEASTFTDGGSSWTKRINVENAAFYSSVKFSYADAATGKPVDWISVVYGGNDLCHWMVTAQENTGEERSVKVTATYSDVKGYVIQEEKYKTKELIITQDAAGSNKKLTFFGGIGDTTIDAVKVEDKDLGYCVIDVNGVHAEDWSGNSHNEAELYGSVTITPYVFGTGVGAGATVADWLTVGYGKDSEGKFNTTHILVTAQDNTGAERKSLVYCVYKAPEGYEFEGGKRKVERQFIVTQKSGLTVEAAFTGFPTEAVAAAGATVKGSLSLTINGKNQTDVAAAISTYGLSLSADKGASASVDADGTVTVVIPENKYKNGGVTYTVSLKKKNDGTVAASAQISQKEGSEEASGDVYTYTIDLAAHADGGVIGFPTSFDDGGVYFRFKEIKKNGEPVEITDDVINDIIAIAFVPSNDRPATGYDSYTYADAGQIFIKKNKTANGQIEFAICTTADSKGYGGTMNLMNADGSKNRSIFYFVP